MSTQTTTLPSPGSDGPESFERPADAPHLRRGRSSRSRPWRGPLSDPSWTRPALLALLATTALLYLWGLGSSGYATSFYSAAPHH